MTTLQTEQAARPDILKKLTYHRHERDDMTLDDCLEYLANRWKKIHGRPERALIMQITELLAAAPQQPVAAGQPAPDQEEDAYVIKRLSTILADVAIVLKGEELPLHRHSYHDLADVARTLKLEVELHRMQEAERNASTNQSVQAAAQPAMTPKRAEFVKWLKDVHGIVPDVYPDLPKGSAYCGQDFMRNLVDFTAEEATNGAWQMPLFTADQMKEYAHRALLASQPSAPADVAAVRDAALEEAAEVCSDIARNYIKHKERSTYEPLGLDASSCAYAIRAMKSAAPTAQPQAKPCQHIYHAVAIDGSNLATSAVKAVCMHCGFEPEPQADGVAK